MKSIIPVALLRRGTMFTLVPSLVVLGAAAVTACDSDDASDASPTAVPTSIVTVSGASQTDSKGTAAANPIVVEVEDQFGRAMPGLTVTFAATGGATVGTATAVSNSSGQVTTTFTAGAAAGTDSVTATLGGSATVALSDVIPETVQ